MQDGFFSLSSRSYAEIPRRPKAYTATKNIAVLQCLAYPKLTRAYTVRTGLFECPAVLLFAPRTPGTRRSSALQGTQAAAD